MINEKELNAGEHFIAQLFNKDVFNIRPRHFDPEALNVKFSVNNSKNAPTLTAGSHALIFEV